MMLDIIYQDEYLVAVNKPAGWLVHRSWLDRHETVFVMQTLRDQIGQHVFPVHRLDRPTSGVLLMALSSEVARTLSVCFEQHQMEKVYHAVVRGYVEEPMIIDSPLVEEHDKIADKFASQPPKIQHCITHCVPLAKVEKEVAIGRYPTSRLAYWNYVLKRGVSINCAVICLIFVILLLGIQPMVIYDKIVGS